MKVAVIIRGFMRTFEVTKKSLIKNVLAPNNADLFVYTYDVCGNSSIPLSANTTIKLNEYKFTDEYGKQDGFGESITEEALRRAYGNYLKCFWIVKNDAYFKSKIAEDTKNVQKIDFDTNRIYSAYYTTTQAIKKFDLWCKEHGCHYDAVILMRPDLHIYSKVLVNNMCMKEINVPDNGGNINICGKTEIYEVLSYKNVERCEYIPYKEKYFTDQFLISSYENIIRLKSFYDSLPKYERRGFPTAHPESVMFYHMAYLPDVPVKLQHIHYEILRTNYIPVQSIINPMGENINFVEKTSQNNDEKPYICLKSLKIAKINAKLICCTDKYVKIKNIFLPPLETVFKWAVAPVRLIKYMIKIGVLNMKLKNTEKKYVDLASYQLDYLFSEYKNTQNFVPNFYNEIKNICKSDQYNLILTYHMGDIFFTAYNYKCFEKKYNRPLHFIVRPSQEIVLKLLKIKNYTVFDFDRYIDPYLSNMFEDKTTYGYVKMMICENVLNTVPTIGEPFVVSIKNNYYLEEMLCKHRNYPINFFHEWGLCLGFDNKAKKIDTKLDIPEISKNTREELERISSLNKIVVFAPETRSDTMFDVNFWNSLASSITKKGYSIIVNTTDRCFNIDGGIKIDMSFSDLVALCHHCHSVFSIRSGLCDILFQKGKNLYVFYTKGRWKSGRWGKNKKKYISINNLFKLPRRNRVNEIIIDRKLPKIMWNGIDLGQGLKKEWMPDYQPFNFDWTLLCGIKTKRGINLKRKTVYFCFIPIYSSKKTDRKLTRRFLGIPVYKKKLK